MRRLRRIFLARAATTLAFAVLTTVGAWAQQTQVSTTYIDADDQSQTVDAYVLDGSETTLGVEGSETSVAYVANSDINFDNVLTLASDVIIILGDGKTVNFGTDTTPLTAPAIYGSNNYSLAIYSQSRGENMGKLNIYSSNIGIQAKKLTIGGGDYTIVTSYPCLSANDDVLITGIGSMTLESESNSAILSNYDITISGDKIVAKGQNNVIKGYIIDRKSVV